IRRAVSDADATPRAQISPGDSATIAAPAPRDSGDSAPPQLRRPASSADSGIVVAESRRSLHAEADNGATRMPSPPQVGRPAGATASGNLQTSQRMSASGDPFIEQAREAALSFTETLPNYVVKQFTT